MGKGDALASVVSSPCHQFGLYCCVQSGRCASWNQVWITIVQCEYEACQIDTEGKTEDGESKMVSRRRCTINRAFWPKNCESAKLRRRNCEVLIAKYELWTVNLSILHRNLPLTSSQERLGWYFAAYGTPLGAFWSPMGLVLEPFESFSSHFRSLLDRLREAPGGQYDFGHQNQRFWRSFWIPNSKKICSG